MTPHDIELTATRMGDTVTVAGKGGANLPANSGTHRFNFTLKDESGVNVAFASLDCADDWDKCPPPGGHNSGQLVGVVMNNNRNPKTAGFTDNNNNPATQGPLSVCYQWNFSCDDPRVTVESFDPVITNGGTN